MTNFNLSNLETIIEQRASIDDGSSYTAMLVKTGIEKCAQKMGEEATEAVIAAVTKNRPEMVKESADVLYHLLVVLRKMDIPLVEVMAELETRTAQSGLEEKAKRAKK
ncbi:MAG: phosphoribosyl-ATP diphosphatase [Rhizobiaceae bacterium]|nr:phosphoribosyl-ATP diphosphatase [Rhizobiaceae bacterium]MBL4696906.1 phosphoribosyl-ATP diphosphatase [Rhizobiaceae bacterium]